MVSMYRSNRAEAELEQLLEHIDRAVMRRVRRSRRIDRGEAQVTPTWRDHLRASAANRIGRIQGLPRPVVEQRLRAAGFTPYPSVAGGSTTSGSVTWRHRDGSGVRVDPGHRPQRGPARGGYPSDLRVHYHKFIEYPGAPRILLNDRGRAIPMVQDARGRQVPRHPARAHILSGVRQGEYEWLFETDGQEAMSAPRGMRPGPDRITQQLIRARTALGQALYTLQQGNQQAAAQALATALGALRGTGAVASAAQTFTNEAHTNLTRYFNVERALHFTRLAFARAGEAIRQRRTNLRRA